MALDRRTGNFVSRFRLDQTRRAQASQLDLVQVRALAAQRREPDRNGFDIF